MEALERPLRRQRDKRFLYVSDTADTLLGYAITSEGRLEPTESIDHAGGGMAITLRPAGSD